MKKIIVVLLSLLLTLSLVACDFVNISDFGIFDFLGIGEDEGGGRGGRQETIVELGTTFEFGDLEITVSDDFGFKILNERWSAFDGEYIVSLPVSVTNIGDRSNSLNPWSVTIFFPGGTGMTVTDQLDMGDDNILMEGSVQPNVTKHGYLFVPYRGEGDYIFEFYDPHDDDNNDMVKIIFEVEFDFDSVVGTDFSLGDTVLVEGMEITFADDISWGRINRSWHDLHGREYFVIPVTLYNTSSRTQRFPFSFDTFGPDGTSLGNIGLSVNGDDIRNAGNLLPGAQLTANLHVLYTVDGEYTLQFTGWNHGDVTIRVQIER